jgi:hypothetical protein
MATSKKMGSLTETEVNSFKSAKARANQMLNRLGVLELEKARIVADLKQNEVNTQNMFEGVRTRLNIDNNTAWQIMEDGSVFVLSDEEATQS